MRCSNCKNDNPNGYRYCLECGEDLGEPTLVQRPETVTRVAAPRVADHRILVETPPPPLSHQTLFTNADPSQRGSLFSAVGGAAIGIAVAFGILLLIVGGYSVFIYLNGEDPLGIAVDVSRQSAPQPSTTKSSRPEPTQRVESTRAPDEVSAPREQVPEPTAIPTKIPEPALVALMPESIHVDAGSYSATRFDVDSEGIRVVGSFLSSSPVEFFIADAAYEPDLRQNRSFPLIWGSGRVTAVQNINVKLPPGHYVVGFNNRFSIFTSKNIAARIMLSH